MARRRYQKGSIKFTKGKYRARWREDVVLADGKVKRIHKRRTLGGKQDFKTIREAQRALDLILGPINSLEYRPNHQITFAEFARRWREKIFSIAYKEGGSQATAGRHMKGKLIPTFGNIELKDITTEVLQSYVADLLGRGLSGKYVRNIISTFSAAWDVALAWKYVTHKPFADLILPVCDPADVEPFTAEEVKIIFAAASGPFKTFLWVLGECGMRPAEVCALDAKNIHLDDKVISVRQAESLGRVVRPKTFAGFRDFAISPQLAAHLREFLGDKEEGFLFVSRTGRPWRESKVTEKRLNQLLRSLGIKKNGQALNGFRHFNATVMDANNVPVKTRQSRLGHDDPRVTLGMKSKSGYSHMIGEDDRRTAAMFGDMFSQVLCPDVSKSKPAASVGSSVTD